MKPPSYSYKKRDNTLSLSVITTRRHYCLSRIIARKPHSLALLSQRRQCSLSFCYSYTCILLSLSYQNEETIASLSIITKEDSTFSFSPHLSPSLPISPLFLCTTRCSRAVLRKEPLHQLFTERLHQLSLHQLKHCTNSRKHCTNSREQCTNSHYTNFLARLRSLTHSRASARTRVLANSLARARMCSAR